MSDLWQAWHGILVESGGQAGAVGHFHQMSKQAETGHVGHGGHLWKTGEMLTGPVQLHHQVAGHVLIGCVQLAFLFCRGVDADTQWLGQVQSTACGCRIVAFELSLVYLTGYGKAENWLDVSIEWPPARGMPAALQAVRPPRTTSAAISGAKTLTGQPKMAMAISGVPPMA